jgi:hypothetical protein
LFIFYKPRNKSIGSNKYTIISQHLYGYEIVYSLHRCHQEKFSTVFVLLGGFQKLMNYVKDGSRFEEMMCQLDFFWEASENKLVSGKDFIRYFLELLALSRG